MGEYYSNSRPTVLNKLHVQSYSRISVLGPEGHCTNRFKRAVCISCRPRVDCGRPQGGRGVWPMWTGEGVKTLIFCGRHKWMAPFQSGCFSEIDRSVYIK